MLYRAAMNARPVSRLLTAFVLALFSLVPRTASATDTLCDTAFQDCRAPLIQLIRQENVRIDVAFWFMEDSRFSAEILKRWQAGVPVRVIIDQRAFPSMGGTHPVDEQIVQTLVSAGIPIRQRALTNPYILHWKTMVFQGQNTVEFSGANYSPTAFVPQDPYRDYEDEAIYFTDDASIVGSFMTKFDDLWVDTTNYADYANITAAPTRVYPIYPKDPQLNFPQQESYATRLLGRYPKETQGLDVIMFRITDERETNAVIQTYQRGIPVRIISDTDEYRDPGRQWVSYNMDRLWAAGVPFKVRAHLGLNHQKLVLFKSQGMSVFGSSNWTSPSDKGQQEHNMFSTRPAIFQWFADQFERKWNNTAPNGAIETDWFVPLPPDKPVLQAPLNGATDQPLSIALRWDGGYYGHIYDVYFGTDPNPPLYATNLQLGPTDPANPAVIQKLVLPLLQHGTTYFWRVVGKTMAGKTAKSAIYSFTTGGTAPPPPPAPAGATTVVMWTSTNVSAPNIAGDWQFNNDATAAGGRSLWNPDHATARVSPPLPAPVNYFETTFTAVAGVPYHLWVRLKAQGNSLTNNSISVQFDDALDRFGSPLYRIGSAQGAEIVLQDASGLSNWGWEDNGFQGGAPTMIYFPATGTHRLRIQQRYDGAMVDQIVLSPDAFVTTAPGPTRDDAHIYGSTVDGAAPPSAPPPQQAVPPLPSGWQRQDIGNVGMPGYAEIDSNAVFTLVGAGADVWGSADALHYAYTTLNGDGTIVARVTAVQNTNAWVKAGVMIRDTTAANSAQAFMLLSYSKGTAFQRRLVTGNSSMSTTGTSSVVAPYWVRLDRAGNVITAYQSADGVVWKKVSSDTFTMGAAVLVGLAVSSHTTDAVASVTFDQVSVNGIRVMPPCGFTLSPASDTIGSAGGSVSVGGTTGPTCAWTASSNASWITVTAGAGTGSGTAGLNAEPNNGAPRTGTATIGGQTYTLSQNSSSCTYSITPASQAFANSGGTASIALSTPAWCSWSAVSNDPSWLTVTGATSGTGSATIGISAAANAAGPRSAFVSIAGQTFAATQSAAACTYSISPTSQVLAAGGDSSTITVTTGYWCSWTATSNDRWLTLGVTSGTGSGGVPVSAAVNNGAQRTGTAVVAGQTYTATQLVTTMPADWSHQDVGAVGIAGDATFNASTYMLTGAGADVWGIADAFHFAYQSLTGDGSIIARVAAVQNVNAWTKAGVMIRDTLDPGSANAFMLVSYSKGLSFQRRASAGATTVSSAGPLSAAPYWVRLDRVGSTVTAYQSADAVVWTLVGTDTVALGSTVLIGVGVSSHTSTAAASATFENVTVNAGPPASPTPWMHRDVGVVGAAGNATFNSSTTTYTVKGGGADIWGNADAFHFLYRPMTGDGAIVARVTSVQNVNSWTKAGVMIRETLDPGSAHATMFVSYSKGTAFQRRTASGGTSTSTTGPLTAAPYWVKMERIGTTFNAYTSADGMTWTLVGSDTIPMASAVYVGLAISSHTTAAAASATFDNVTAP